MLRDVLTAFRTLTILPLPGKDTTDFSRTLFFFPLVGAFLGLIVVGIQAGAARVGFDQSGILAALCVVLVTWITGGLHVDGLGDVADAFGARKAKERTLEILKDPRMGSFGVTAIVLGLLIKVFCWQFFFVQGQATAILWSLVFARSMQGLFIAFVPNARPGSIAGVFRVENPLGKGMVVFSFLLTGAVAAFSASLPAALVFACSSLLVTTLFGLYCMRKIGGITGDCVGAANELAEISVLLGGITVI